MAVQIAHPQAKYGRVPLGAPSPLGYLHIAAQAGAPSIPFRSRLDPEWLAGVRERARRLSAAEGVRSVTLFRAVGLPPVERLPYVREHAADIRVARFDLVVLAETDAPSTLAAVQGTADYAALLRFLQGGAQGVHVLAGRNSKRVGLTDPGRDGLFLFNYFVAEDADALMEVWEYLADWYRVEMGLDNSTLLVPAHPRNCDYPAINFARFEGGLPAFLARQMAKPSFRTYLLANLEAHRIGAMPILYRRA